MVRIRIIAGVVAALATVAQVSAGFVDVTGGYNLLSFGDINVKWSDSEGKVAGAGNVSIESYSIGSHATPSLYSLVGGGDVSYKWGTISNGGIYAGGDAYVSGANVQGSIAVVGNAIVDPYMQSQVVHTTSNACPVNFSAKETEAISLSSNYASMSSNGTIGVDLNGFLLSGSNSVNYFTMTASQLASASALTFNVGTGVSIINVSGSNASLGNFGFFNYDASKILFNFYEAETLMLSNAGIKGSVLAAKADVNFNQGHIDGSLVSQSLSGYGEFHQYTFDEPPQDVPEGSATVMMLAGALLLIVVSRKKLSFSRI